MNAHHTVAAFAAITLMAGSSFAGDFGSDLAEAKVVAQTVGKATRQVVIPALNAAEGLNAIGKSAQARAQLNFARGNLGLSTSPLPVATPVLALPPAPQDFEAQLEEAKVASARASRENREQLTTHLRAAESLAGQGEREQAWDYLNFARGKLGLEISMTAPSTDTRIEGLRPEPR
jgi:hypothetical protein